MSRLKREAGQEAVHAAEERVPSPLRLLVAANIAVCRKKSGLTQSQTARLLGLEKETISRIEGGKISVNVGRLEEFADLFHCDVRDLLFGADDASADRHGEAAVGAGRAGPRSGNELSTCAASDSECRTGRATERHGMDTKP